LVFSFIHLLTQEMKINLVNYANTLSNVYLRYDGKGERGIVHISFDSIMRVKYFALTIKGTDTESLSGYVINKKGSSDCVCRVLSILFKTEIQSVDNFFEEKGILYDMVLE